MSAVRLLLLPFVCLCAFSAAAQPADAPTGPQIMQEVQRRYLLDKSIYEELILILTDRLGQRDTRNLRRYSKTDGTGNTRFLLLFDTPAEVRGVGLLAERAASGRTSIRVYLPADGREYMQPFDTGVDGNLMGTDFSLEQMIGEQAQHYQYVLAGQQKMGNINHYRVDVYRAGDNVAMARPIRRHYVREDGYYITRTDYLDNDGRLLKQKTLHDLRQTGPGSWQAGMVLMEDPVAQHSTLMKIKRTIFSSEYVPDEVFTRDWLYRNQPPALAAEVDDMTAAPAMIEPTPDAERPAAGPGKP